MPYQNLQELTPFDAVYFHTSNEEHTYISEGAAFLLISELSDLLLANLIITSSEVYEAPGSIIIGPNVTIAAGASVTVRAGGEIILGPGFTAQAGSEFHAYIDPGLAP